jgi:hypothetical protein
MLRFISNAFGVTVALFFCQSVIAGGLPESTNEAQPVYSEQTSKPVYSEQTSKPVYSEQTSNGQAKQSKNQTSITSDQNIQDENASGAAFVAIEDDPLIVDVSDIADSDGMGASQIQWQISRDGKNWLNLSGAVQQSFTPREAHVDQYLRVVISYVDGQGKLETLISPPSTAVKNINDKPTGSPRLSGEAREKSTLIVDASLISDEDGIGSYEIIWQQSKTSNNWQQYPSADGGVLQLTQKDVGYSFRAVVSYIDSRGTREVLVTSPSEAVINVDDPVDGEAIIVGEPLEGTTLTADTSSIADLDGIASTNLTWEASSDGRNWESIPVITPKSLSLGQGLVGKQIRIRVSVVDTFGVESILFSKSSLAVRNVNNKPAGKIIVRRVGN